MNLWLWLMVVVLALTMYGLGCISARAHFVSGKSSTDKAVKMISNNRANAVLAVFFTMIALAVGVDTVYLQVKVNRYMHGQVDCNTHLLNHLQAVNSQRQKVDDAAAQFDMAMQAYAATSALKSTVPIDDPAYINLQDKLSAVTHERLLMLEVYSAHADVGC